MMGHATAKCIGFEDGIEKIVDRGADVVKNASLLVVQGVEQGARFELGDRPLAMGRDARNDIRILDNEVSRNHCTIQRVKDEFVLTDRNSSNGTLVNGVAIRSHMLVDGDQIQLGNTLLLFSNASRDSWKDNAAERVNLLRRHDPADRSSIVTHMGQEIVETSSPTRDEAADSPNSLSVLYRIAEEVARPSSSLEQSLQRTLDLTVSAVFADRGCVLLSDPQSGEIQPQVTSQRVAGVPGARMPISRTIVDYVLKTCQGVRTTDAQHDTRFDPTDSIFRAGIREAMCVPMQGRHQLMGVIYVDITTPADSFLMPREKSGGFREDQLRLLIAIGRHTALAVENNRYQHAFVKAERMAAMGQTIATLSHHIKNILQGVRGGSYLIDMGLNGHNEELVRKGWHVVEKNQNRIYNLVMDMLTFSKERKPAYQQSQLNDTVHDVFELMQARANEFAVELRFEPATNLPLCTFDPEGIHRAVLNIVTNAIDAVEGSDRALVKIETGLDPVTDMFWVCVTDNGPGIVEDQLQRIFNVFESTKGARGTGLGLAVSQKIIREHGGEITVKSRLGEGSRFMLAWPRLEDSGSAGSRTTI
ncbi:ATP-binding protein [Schlesneria sp. T3-172]|uniref:ATP-binding protein n=1 Tax=Schlesneria sphaerica TaxID=3373610 RepID=UPI0037C79B4E